MRQLLQSEAKQKTQGNPQGPHGDSLGIENYSCLEEAVPILGLACLAYKPVDFKALEHGWVCVICWLDAHSSKRCIFLKSILGTAAGPIQNVLEQRQSYQSSSYPK